MKKFIILFLLITLMIASSRDEKIPVFDKNGDEIAYIAMDHDLTIILNDGTPVAYILRPVISEKPKLVNESIYGFNGKHLGWILENIIRDHEGYSIGFMEGATNIKINMHKWQRIPKLSPGRNTREIEPPEPIFNNKWSGKSLKDFLKKGITK